LEFRREFVLKNYTTLLREGNHSVFLEFSFVRKDLLEKLSIRRHLGDGVQEGDINLQLFEHF